ncbi:MAG: hypothetical protein SRB1_02431 [Desulfobacteraceae bacterium Eth-SRB1]|nr:MAG: hypothetical protein SRB1_02431 [Desulfobacteraceae bacterium Eth-SRB1]
MTTTNCEKFKGEIQNYLVNGQNNFDSKIDSLFSSLKFKTWLCRTNIIKKGKRSINRTNYLASVVPGSDTEEAGIYNLRSSQPPAVSQTDSADNDRVPVH